MKTSKPQFILFKQSFNYWKNRLGLHEWVIDFFHDSTPGSFADIVSNHNGLRASVRMTNKLDKVDMAAFNPKKAGKHEAIHLLLADIRGLAVERFLTEDEMSIAIERIVRRLEGVL